MMLSRLQVTTIIGLAALIWSILLFFDGYALETSLIKPLSPVVGIIVFLIFAYDKWIWKFPLINPHIIKIPNLNGTWKGVLESSYIDPNTNEKIAPIIAFIVITQTQSSINVRQITKESSSDLLSGEVYCDKSGMYNIVGVYSNEPKLLIQERSPIHYGGLRLKVQRGDCLSLEGEYWTTRNTNGTMFFDQHISEFLDNFDNAMNKLPN